MAGRPWTTAELRRIARCRTPADCDRVAATMDRTATAVNIKRIRQGRSVFTRRQWTPAEDAELLRVDTSVRGWSLRLAAKFGCSSNALRLRRRRLQGYPR